MVAATTLIDSAEPAFERLFGDEYVRVVSVAFRITRDTFEAEDVAQEVFARFARSPRRDFSKAAGWLYRAAVHTALNSVRAQKRRRAREQREFALRRSMDEAAYRTTDPQQILERSDNAAMVRAALMRLSSRDAEVLALRYAGLSYAEIADAISVDVRQIGTRLLRAERAFKREIERETFG
jgi:RNA polymerase sigma-70 factor (ECF subfamily)